MKAHPDDQRKLLHLQELDNQITLVKKTITSLPEMSEREALIELLKSMSQELVSAQGELEDAQRELSRIDDDLQVVEKRIQLDKDRENASASVKDVQALEAELESLSQRKVILEDAELEAMQVVEDQEKNLAEISERRHGVEKQIQDLTEHIAHRTKELEAEVSHAMTERTELVSTLPGELVDLYEKQKARYGVGAALLKGKISGASGVELTPTDLDKIRATPEDEVVLCPDSSCILVRTEESGIA